MGLRIGGEEIECLSEVDGGVGAERNHGGEAHIVLARPIQNRRSERARLGDQRQRAFGGEWPDHAGVQAQAWALEAQAVGAQQMDAVAFGHLVHVAGQLC